MTLQALTGTDLTGWIIGWFIITTFFSLRRDKTMKQRVVRYTYTAVAFYIVSQILSHIHIFWK